MIHYLQISKMRGKLAKLHTVASLVYAVHKRMSVGGGGGLLYTRQDGQIVCCRQKQQR